jgi:hypothetical protein
VIQVWRALLLAAMRWWMGMEGLATATAKYRDLSTTAAKSAAFGRDDV